MAKASSLKSVIPTATTRKYMSATKAIIRGLISPIVLGSGEVYTKTYRGGVTKIGYQSHKLDKRIKLGVTA